MQLSKKKSTFDHANVEKMVIKENKFITELFSELNIPLRNDEDNDDEDDPQDRQLAKVQENGKPRAKSLSELQQRLVAITSKKTLSYKEKMTKKGLKNRMKKKSKADERNAEAKQKRAHKALVKSEIKAENGGTESTTNEVKKIAKPVFNSEGKMVFSKFDFSNIGENKSKKGEKDPKKLLKNLEKEKEKIKMLKESGEIDKAIEVKEKTIWKNALAKAGGEKVKDDPTLLKKTLKRKEQKQRSNKNKWDKRIEGVNKAKDDKQKKRTENLDKRKKDKKLGKLKKASKRGRVIPGF